MSQHAARPSGDPHGEIGRAWTAAPQRPPGDQGHSWMTGGAVFAGVLMLCGGALAVLQGIAAIAGDDVYRRIGDYVYELDLTGWGWIHVILGALVAVTGLGVLKGMAWARFAGILLASLSLISQFLFLPYAPLWSVVMMAIDVFVIWSLAAQQEAAGRGAA